MTNKQRTAAIFLAGLVIGASATVAIIVVLDGRHQELQYDAELIAGVAARQSGDLIGAEQHYFTATAIAPTEHVSYMALAEIFESQNRADDARRLYQSALERIEAKMGNASEQQLRKLRLDKEKTVRSLGVLSSPQREGEGTERK